MADEQPSSPLADEVVKLVGVAQRWARDTFPATPDGHTGPQCQWCPLCQVLALLRGDRPEVGERVAEIGVLLANVLRGLAEAASSTAASSTAASSTAASSAAGTAEPAAPAAPRVQHIDLSEPDE